MADQNILDRSMRSVFVGNIPYETTEEKLKDIFNEVGPVVSFKLVYDRESGKPKGYGFCEYKDQETAFSAMRNLNCYEIGGRSLRVDNACTEKSRLEMQSLIMGMPISESYYGNAVCAEKAPDIINNVVATLPPEQLYELMKQMKDCVLNNPVEARNLLLQNPQFSYALLQAQVVMKIVKPEEAQAMLYPTNDVPVKLRSSKVSTVKVQQSPTTPNNNIHWRNLSSQTSNLDWHHTMNGPSNQLPFFSQTPTYNELSYLDYSQTPVLNIENRNFTDCTPTHNYMPILPPMSVPPPSIIRPTQPQELPLQIQQIQPLGETQQLLPSNADSEKASLILQVMQLTDEQIATLPVNKRESIIQLKEKILFSSKN